MESRSRRLAAQAEVTISRMERQLATHKAIVGETTTMEVTMIDLYEYMTKLRAELNTRLDALEAKVNAPAARAAAPRPAAAAPAAGGTTRTGVIEATEWVNRQKKDGGTFQVLEVTFANGWRRTIPGYKKDICDYFVALSPGETATYVEAKKNGFNEIVGVG